MVEYSLKRQIKSGPRKNYVCHSVHNCSAVCMVTRDQYTISRTCSFIKTYRGTYYHIAPTGIAFLRILMHSLTFRFAVLAYLAPPHLFCSSYWQAPIQLTRRKTLLAQLGLFSRLNVVHKTKCGYFTISLCAEIQPRLIFRKFSL